MSVYLFSAVDRWPGPPNYVANVRTNQAYSAVVPPGEYHVIVARGVGERMDILGLPSFWPRSITVGEPVASAPARIDSKLSLPITRRVRAALAQRGGDNLAHIRNRAAIEANSLSGYGRVLLRGEVPAQGAILQLRQAGNSTATPDLSAALNGVTTADGRFAFPPVGVAYSIGAMTVWPLSDEPGERWQHIKPNVSWQGKQQVDVVIPDWPSKTGTISGRFVDSDGKDVDAFIVSVDRGYWPKVGAPTEPLLENWGIKAGFSNGRFEIKDVPAGECTVAINLANRSVLMHRGLAVASPNASKKLMITPGLVHHADFQLALDKSK